MASNPIPVFIGSGEQSVLERKVLIYSLRKHSKRDLAIHVFNGTHNAIERENEPPSLAPLSLQLKYRNMTEFSLYRYLIPQLCSFQGKAIYLDSDMVCFSDIAQLFDAPMANSDFLAKKIESAGGEKTWESSVMLIDCARCRFDLDQIFAEIDAQAYTYREFSRLGKGFLALHPYRIGEIDPNWNVLDYCDSSTKLIHYTDLFTQPWKYPDHPHGHVWFAYLREAMGAKFITQRDIDLAILRGHARADLRQGNNPRLVGKVRHRLKQWITRTQSAIERKASV